MSVMINTQDELLLEEIAFGKAGTQVIGYLPKGAIIVSVHVSIDTTFTAGTNIDLGFTSNPIALIDSTITSVSKALFIQTNKREEVVVRTNQDSIAGSGKVAIHYFLPTMSPRDY